MEDKMDAEAPVIGMLIGYQCLVQELAAKGAIDLQSLQKRLSAADDFLDETAMPKKDAIRSWLHALMTGPMASGH